MRPTKCPNCGRLFYINISTDASVLNVTLGDTNMSFEYCSKLCMERKIKGMDNFKGVDKLKIIEQKVVREHHPFTMKLVVEHDFRLVVC